VPASRANKAHRGAHSAGTRARCRRRDGALAPCRCIAPRPFIFTMSNSAVFFVPGRFCSRFFLFCFLPSQLPHPDRGDGGAPGGGILSPVAPVTTRHHVCEAWAVPRNRNGASRRSTVTVLGPLRALGSGVASGFVRAGNPCCRHRFRSAKGPEPPGNGFTSRQRTPPPAPPSGSPRESAPR
jgi:hypothetical protein